MMKTCIAVVAVLAASLAGISAQSSPAAKDVNVFGFKLHYLEAGRGAPVILLHGLGGDGSRWGPNVEVLSRDFHIFALDQIGFGQSDKPLANYHTGMLAEFLVGFLKAANIPKASLVGNSMGAGVALYTAVHYPDVVDRIVLADGGGYRSPTVIAPAAPTPRPSIAVRSRTASRATRRASSSESCSTTKASSPTGWWTSSSPCGSGRRLPSRKCRKPARRGSVASMKTRCAG